MSEPKFKTRDEARAAIAAAGITVDNVTLPQLRLLRTLINKRMKLSGNYRGTYRMCGIAGKFMGCTTDQWVQREAISFNSDGFIGFAGWADRKNTQPILDGVADWLEHLKDNDSDGEETPT